MLENYVFQEWNSSVEKLAVLGKPRSNSYLAHLRTNKYSLISYPRECLLLITYYQSCSCRSDPSLEGNSYLIIESVPNGNELQATGAVRMELRQVVELSKDREDPKLLLMTVTT